MTQIERYQKPVATVTADQTVLEAADRMRLEGMGSLVIVAADGHPVGIVTDRDLSIRVVAEGRDPEELLVSAVMSQPLVEAEASDSIEQVIEVMQEHGVRRLPIVSEKQVVGLVSFDDLIVALAAELDDVAVAARREIGTSQRVARVRQLRREVEDSVQELIGHVERVGDQALEAGVRELEGVIRGVRRLFD